MDTSCLIERSLNGDKDAFAQLFDMNKMSIKGLLISLSNNEFDSNDMLQDTFIKAYLKLGTYKKSLSFNTWLSSIAKNTFLDYVRKRTVKSNILLVEDTAVHDILEEGVEQVLIKKEMLEEIASYIECMPTKYRKILELRFYIGKDYREISIELGIPEGTVKTHLHRAKEELKKKINHLRK